MHSNLSYFDDPNFVFDPGAHSYSYLNPETGKPVQIFESASKFLGQFKKPFDAQTISRFVAKSRKTTQEAILAEWDKSRVDGLNLGSIVHDWIEEHYKGNNPPLPSLPDNPFAEFGISDEYYDTGDSVEAKAAFRIEKFLKVYEDRLHIFKPVDQELRMFHRKWGIAGTLDILFELNGELYVGDWKTNKKFTTDDDKKDGRRQKMLAPFDDLWDNSLNGYSMQVSLYRLMLEEAGIETKGGFIVWIGPNETKMYKTLDLRSRLKEFLDENNFSL